MVSVLLIPGIEIGRVTELAVTRTRQGVAKDFIDT